MFLIIMILSMPVYEQAGVDDFSVDLEVGIDAPQWDEKLGHFDILPEIVVVAARPAGIETSRSYYVIDTVFVVAERFVPAADRQHSRTGYAGMAFDYLRYAFYIVITIITAAMVAITISRIPYGFRKNQICRKPETVRLQQLLRRKR